VPACNNLNDTGGVGGGGPVWFFLFVQTGTGGMRARNFSNVLGMGVVIVRMKMHKSFSFNVGRFVDLVHVKVGRKASLLLNERVGVRRLSVCQEQKCKACFWVPSSGGRTDYGGGVWSVACYAGRLIVFLVSATRV